MPDGVRIRLEGLRQAVRSLDELDRRARRRVCTYAVRRGNRELLKAVRSDTPRDTGTMASQMRQSIKTDRASGTVTGTIKPKRTKSQEKKGQQRRGSVVHLVVGGVRPHRIPGPVSFRGKVYANIEHPGFPGNDFLERAARRAFHPTVSEFRKAFGARLEEEARKLNKGT